LGLPFFGGLPPRFPFCREALAFRLDRAEPRQAGQKQINGIL
jgi:hypothetical protein